MHYVSTNIPVKVHIVQVGDMSFSIIGRCLFKTTQEVTDINAVKTHAHGSRCQIQHFCHILHPKNVTLKLLRFQGTFFISKFELQAQSFYLEVILGSCYEFILRHIQS